MDQMQDFPAGNQDSNPACDQMLMLLCCIFIIASIIIYYYYCGDPLVQDA